MLVFWLWVMRNLSCLSQDGTHTPSIGRRSLNHWSSGKSQTVLIYRAWDVKMKIGRHPVLLTAGFFPLKVKVLLSRVLLFLTPWTVAHQAPLSMGFPRQEYWSGLPFSSPGDLPDPGVKPTSPALQADSLPSELPGKPLWLFLTWPFCHLGSATHVQLEERIFCNEQRRL